jgi:flagellar hook-basal body complex protein FliE
MAMPSINSNTPSRLDMPLSARLAGKTPGLAVGSTDFSSLLTQGIGEVNSLQGQANQAVNEMLSGGDVQPAEVYTSIQKADMAFRMLLQVRNKLMQAYEEVNSIRI